MRQTNRASHEFIREQLEKCDRKLHDGDYDGAITNARSAVEAVLVDIESRLDATPVGIAMATLPKLNKRVQKLLNLDPARPDISESLRQLLSGFVQHHRGPCTSAQQDGGCARSGPYKPARHHAKLAVNAA